VVGARLLYILQNLNAFARDPVSVFRVWEGGLSFHGGVVGGAIGIIWFLRRHKLPVLKVGDVIMPCLLLGLGWGRIGCFMNGCCYGKVCKDLPWAVTFPEGSPAYLWHLESGLIGDHAARCLPVHPVQVYSSISAVGLALFLVWVLSRKRFDGEVMVCAAGTYGVLRFLLEFLRDDDSPILAGLTQSQLFSIGLLALGILLYWTLRPREAGA
jgi:phosphatidylglycerol:prolipoprotein diacylglycerol transferase